MNNQTQIQNNPHELFASFARLAQKAILREAVLFPKPGLVDPKSAGAHKDMDIGHFVNSTLALYPAFYDFVAIGYSNPKDNAHLLKEIKARGIEAEKEMLLATQGVNTHKGIIFSMGYLLCSVGVLTALGNVTIEGILQKVKELAQGIVERELGNLDHKTLLTHGEILYKNHGLLGARGEVESGFVNALPAYELLKTQKEPNQQTLLKALLLIMTQNDDTNVVSRGGIKALELVKTKSQQLLELEGETLLQELKDFDRLCIQKNISPGGSADLLSVAILLTYIKNKK